MNELTQQYLAKAIEALANLQHFSALQEQTADTIEIKAVVRQALQTLTTVQSRGESA